MSPRPSDSVLPMSEVEDKKNRELEQGLIDSTTPIGDYAIQLD